MSLFLHIRKIDKLDRIDKRKEGKMLIDSYGNIDDSESYNSRDIRKIKRATRDIISNSNDKTYYDELLDMLSIDFDKSFEPINYWVIESTFKVMSSMEENEYQKPSVFPMTEGGLQIELHKGQRHLEVSISNDRSYEAFYYDSETDETHETHIGANLDDVERFLRNQREKFLSGE